MLGHTLCSVKREPLSDEEDTETQYTANYILTNQLTAKYYPDKIELPHNDDSITKNLLRNLQNNGLEELSPLTPAGPAATPVCVKQERTSPPATTLEVLECTSQHAKNVSLLAMINNSNVSGSTEYMPLTVVKDELSSEGEQVHLSGDDTSDSCERHMSPVQRNSPKSWTQHDMERALHALRQHQMSLTKASATYGIPSTTLWQRAHRLGIDTPKKEGATKTWSEADLRGALHALRAGAISANKASKAYGIPSSTLYKIARREGIRLSAPFNAAPTAWRRADLRLALAAIRSGASSVQRAAATYGIPSGTLYGRCKREGIELSRSNPTPWSEDSMGEALEAVRLGHMSINQAAIHFNLPYSSLYGRFKRCKYQMQNITDNQQSTPDHQKPVQESQQMSVHQCHSQVPAPHTHMYTHAHSYAHDAHTHAQYTHYYHSFQGHGTHGIATS